MAQEGKERHGKGSTGLERTPEPVECSLIGLTERFIQLHWGELNTPFCLSTHAHIM